MILHKNLSFSIKDEQVLLRDFGNLKDLETGFVQVQIAGENKDSHMGIKMVNSSESRKLKYVSHSIEGNALTITQRSNLIQADTTFLCYDNANAVRIHTTVTNISDSPICIEEVSILCLTGFGDKNTPDNYHLTRFLQSHHAECQPRRNSFRELGLCGGRSDGQQRASVANIGSWSTKEALPMGIIETGNDSDQIMFQIESSNTWYWEVSDLGGKYYLYLGGPNSSLGGWFKNLNPNESYTTPTAAVAFGRDLNEVLGQMTLYRRNIAGKCPADSGLPTIFNEYMHLSWDSPTAENTAKYAPIVAKTGVEYYVIDCGWHNEEDGNKIYPFVGHWLESKARFPEGVRKTTDYIRSLGMKPGLWIEPEIIGIQCEKMLQHYSDDCFFQRHGKRLAVMNRHFLDFRNPAVREYMSETIRRMIEDYGTEYIKCDYNQDCGIGTDLNADNAAQGLEEASDAFESWICEMIAKYPNVIFEGCSSGGMRMDYKTLSAYSLVSTSDQTDYLLYPYIAGNILSAVLPEQAAVWSYPVANDCTYGTEVTDDRIAINMINSFLGRMHLASHLDYLNEHQMDLIREGVSYYNSLSEIKKEALPYFPLGFTSFDAPTVCAGLIHNQKIYLALWNLKNARFTHIPFDRKIKDTKIAYPSSTSVHFCINDRGLDVMYPQSPCAVFLEITTE